MIVLLLACAPQLPVRTVPNAVRVMIAQTPGGELDPWLSRVVAAAERGELTLDDVERIERAVVEVFADGVVEQAEIDGLGARFDLPKAEASSFEMDRVPPMGPAEDRRVIAQQVLANPDTMRCATAGSELHCVGGRPGEVLLARVRRKAWQGARPNTWDQYAEPRCTFELPGGWQVGLVEAWRADGEVPDELPAPESFVEGDGRVETSAGAYRLRPTTSCFIVGSY